MSLSGSHLRFNLAEFLREIIRKDYLIVRPNTSSLTDFDFENNHFLLKIYNFKYIILNELIITFLK